MMLSSPPDQAKYHHHCDPGRPRARGGDDIYVNTPPVSHISVFIPIVPVMAGVTHWHSGPGEGVKCLNGANDDPMTRHRDPGADTWSHHQHSDEAIYSVMDQNARYGPCDMIRCVALWGCQVHGDSWHSSHQNWDPGQLEECLHCRDQELDANIRSQLDIPWSLRSERVVNIAS